MKIIDVITCKLVLIFPEISGKFYNPNLRHRFLGLSMKECLWYTDNFLSYTPLSVGISPNLQLDAIGDKDELITFWGKKVKDQGHSQAKCTIPVEVYQSDNRPSSFVSNAVNNERVSEFSKLFVLWEIAAWCVHISRRWNVSNVVCWWFCGAAEFLDILVDSASRRKLWSSITAWRTIIFVNVDCKFSGVPLNFAGLLL